MLHTHTYASKNLTLNIPSFLPPLQSFIPSVSPFSIPPTMLLYYHEQKRSNTEQLEYIVHMQRYTVHAHVHILCTCSYSHGVMMVLVFGKVRQGNSGSGEISENVFQQLDAIVLDLQQA